MANKFTGIQTAGLDEVEVKKNVEKFKAELNHRYRIGFPLSTEKGTVRIDRVYYFNKFDDTFKGKFIVPEDCNDEQLNKFIEVLGEPIYRYVTPIIVYNTEKDGKVIKPISYKIVPFVFSDGVLADLKAINEEFPLTAHDIIVSLKDNTDPKYQNLSILPTSKEAIWKHEKLVDATQKEANEVAKSMHQAVATQINCNGLKAKLVEAKLLKPETTQAPADTTTVTDVDIDDIDDI